MQQFLPQFVNDTKDLCSNPERISKASLEQNATTCEQAKSKIVEMVIIRMNFRLTCFMKDLYMGVFDVKENNTLKTLNLPGNK